MSQLFPGELHKIILVGKEKGMAQADVWKTHPNMDQFSRNRSSSYPDILQKLNWYSQKLMDEFSRNRAGYILEMEILKKYWMSFPEIGLCHAPDFFEYHFSAKCSILDEFSKNWPVFCPKISKLTI